MRDEFLNQTQERIIASADAAKSNIEQRLPKRFYTEVSVEARDDGHVLLLDGRGAKTPSRRAICLPDAGLAQAVAVEWRAQTEFIDPRKMPMTRLVNAAIEGGVESLADQCAEILRYTDNDLLCYRAVQPDDLIARQEDLWDPVLTHFTDVHGLKFVLTQGILHVDQPPANVVKLGDVLAALSLFEITAISSMMNLCGSALLPLAVAQSVVSGGDAWVAAHVEEDWNIAKWGQDAEAIERREMRRGEFDAGVALLRFLRSGD